VDVGSSRGLDQDGPGKSAEIQGRHSVPRGRVAFVEIALPPNQQIRWDSAVSEVVEGSKSLPLTTSKCSKIAEGPVVAFLY
jgi:hypothetical protein